MGLYGSVLMEKVLMMETIICPKCGTENPADQMNCQKCHLNLEYGQEHSDGLGGPVLHGDLYQPTTPEDLGCLANGMRWVGRIWGLALILFLPVLLFFNYSYMPKGEAPFQLVAFIMIVLGMIVAWGSELIGALISSVGLVGFYVFIWIFEKENFHSWLGSSIFVLPPILLFLGSHLLKRNMKKKVYSE